MKSKSHQYRVQIKDEKWSTLAMNDHESILDNQNKSIEFAEISHLETGMPYRVQINVQGWITIKQFPTVEMQFCGEY